MVFPSSLRPSDEGSWPGFGRGSSLWHHWMRPKNISALDFCFYLKVFFKYFSLSGLSTQEIQKFCIWILQAELCPLWLKVMQHRVDSLRSALWWQSAAKTNNLLSPSTLDDFLSLGFEGERPWFTNKKRLSTPSGLTEAYYSIES